MQHINCYKLVDKQGDDIIKKVLDFIVKYMEWYGEMMAASRGIDLGKDDYAVRFGQIVPVPSSERNKTEY